MSVVDCSQHRITRLVYTVSIKHAILMLAREVAIVEECLRDGHRIGPYPWPFVLRLIRYRQDHFPVPPACLLGPNVAYSAVIIIAVLTARAPQTLLITSCRSPAEAPQQGRQNTVAALHCVNNRKANRTPAEAGMTFRLEAECADVVRMPTIAGTDACPGSQDLPGVRR